MLSAEAEKKERPKLVHLPMPTRRVPLPAVSRSAALQRKDTCELLGRAILNLDDLQHQVEWLRSVPAGELALAFPPSRLELLHRVLAEGRRKLIQRCRDLGAPLADAETPYSISVSPFTSPTRRLPHSGYLGTRHFMRSYRACSHFLCGILQKTQTGADAATAAAIALLLQNLEKQLWVLEGRHTPTDETFLAVTLFHSC